MINLLTPNQSTAGFTCECGNVIAVHDEHLFKCPECGKWHDLSENLNYPVNGTISLKIKKGKLIVTCTKCDKEMEHGVWDKPHYLAEFSTEITGWKCHECGDIFSMSYKMANDKEWRC